MKVNGENKSLDEYIIKEGIATQEELDKVREDVKKFLESLTNTEPKKINLK